MSGHTPGPWKRDLRVGCFAIYPEGRAVNCITEIADEAVVYQNGRGEESSPGSFRYLSDEQIANADIIAAAPELLEALKACVAVLSSMGPLEFNAAIEARAAIAKAEPKS